MFRIPGLLLVLLAMTPPLHAQTTASGSIHGSVKDQQGALLRGVSISAASPSAPRAYMTTTDDEGDYRFGDLPPGDYLITAELAGFARFVRERVTVRAGLHIGLDITMTLGSLDATVDVKADTPLLETQNAVQAVNVAGELLRGLPLSERREWFGALILAPGVTAAEWVNSEKLIYVHGADASANLVQIDGADVSASLASGVGYVGLNTDAIDDIQIKTAGVDASAPLGFGGIINIAMTSGTNQPKGAVTAFVQPRAWNASNTPGGTSSTVDQTQLDLSLGAPVVKDHAWVFGAYRYIDASTGVSRTAAQLEALRALAPGYTPLDNTNTAHFWFGKVTAQLSPAHQLAGFYQNDVNPVMYADPVAVHARREATGGSSASLRFSSVWSDRLTTRLGASFNDKRRDGRSPSVDGPLQRVYQSTIMSGGRLVGVGRLADLGSPVSAWNQQPNSKLTFSFDATLLTRSGFGSHELQSGVYAQPRVQIGSRVFYPNGGFRSEERVLLRPGDYSAGTIPFHRVIADQSTYTNVRRRDQDYAFYAQDAWRPTSRLTINAGARIDHIVGTDLLFDVTSQRSTEIGPRFGINYALTADARNVLRAHWVRVHDQPSDTSTSVGAATIGQSDFYDLDHSGTFKTVFVTRSTFGVTPGHLIDPNFHQPFVQEWGTGYSRQLKGSMTTSVDFLHRLFLDRTTVLETNGLYSGKTFVGYRDERFNDISEVTNNQWNWPVYDSLELSLTKRTSRLQGIASYVRQWRRLAGTWQPHDPASFIQPDAFRDDKGIGSPMGSTQSIDANSLSGDTLTQRATGSAQWQDHSIRAGVMYAAPWNVVLASSYTFGSGIWSGPTISQVAAPDPVFGPPIVTLSNGRRVTNPLATTLRFAFPTRGEGQLTTPALHALNVRVGRNFALRRLRFDASLDVFNVTNNGADTSFQTGGNQTFDPAYGTTTFRQLPRSAQLVLRTSF
jgi:hypothetical protein